MKLSRNFTTSENEDVTRQRIVNCLEESGYRQVSTGPLVYKRGSLLGSLASFSPRGWKCQVQIHISANVEQQTEVSMSYDINTTGQLVTEKERGFWKAESDELEIAIISGKIELGTSRETAKFSLTENLIGGLILIAFSVGFSVLAAWLFDGRLIIFGLVLGLVASFWVIGKWLKIKIR